MYVCECGYKSISTDYCRKCNKVLKCDCSDIIQGRIKDIAIPYHNGERFVKLNYKICETCGNVFDISINRNLISQLKTGESNDSET